MRPPNNIRKGAFFGLLAAALMVALAAVALKTTDQRVQPPIGDVHHHEFAESPGIAPAHTR